MDAPSDVSPKAEDELLMPSDGDGKPLPSAEEVLADRATSYWLKDALETALERDPVDAFNDALLLAAVLEQHLREVLGIDVDPD